jgi:hypothetical protein
MSAQMLHALGLTLYLGVYEIIKDFVTNSSTTVKVQSNPKGRSGFCGLV